MASIINPKYVTEFLMRGGSDVTAQLITEGKVTDPVGSLTLALFGIAVTGPWNVKVNEWVLRFGSSSAALKLALSMGGHLPSTLSLLMLFKISFANLRAGKSLKEALSAAFCGLYSSFLQTWFKAMKVLIPVTVVVQRYVGPAYQTYCFQAAAFVTTTIAMLASNAENKKQAAVKNADPLDSAFEKAYEQGLAKRK